MNDRELRQNIIDEFDFDPSFDGADIGVAVDNGVVTLSGHVASYMEKLCAERAAWRVMGVKAVAQEIQIRLPAEKKTHDDEIARRVVDVLAWSTTFPARDLQIKVEDGFVTLTGRVRWDYQRKAMAAAVGRLTGIKGIINDVQLETLASPADVKQRITSALKRRADLEAWRIDVDVHDNGRVLLTGDVDSWKERQSIEQAAWSAPGVRMVEDHLRIV